MSPAPYTADLSDQSLTIPSAYVNELNTLNHDVVRHQPSDILQFCANYFNRRLEEQRVEFISAAPPKSPSRRASSVAISVGKEAPSPRSSQVTTTSGPVPPMPPLPRTQNDGPFVFPPARADELNDFPRHYNLDRRSSVSAESIVPTTNKDWSPPQIPKTPTQLDRLSRALSQNFLFKMIDEEQKTQIVSALSEVELERDATIIKQGDVGDYFYIIENGTFDVYVSNKKVNTIGSGGSFGELALMYNAPRAASVVSTSPAVLWALDRITFRTILLETTVRKRRMYDSFLEEVPILDSLTPYERVKIADALESQTFNPGETILRQGDTGDNFYLIESGNASVHKSDEGQVATLGKGDYFGELALLNDAPRAASVVARSKIKVAFLGKTGFQRLLGPVTEILKRQGELL